MKKKLRRFRSKKGLGFELIIGLVILFLSGAVITKVISDSASKTDEKLQVDLCRASNEIRLGVERKTKEFLASPRICNTIYKLEEKSKVPTKLYEQDKGGAEAEIREMIKNCWYMWLEGSEYNMFREYPGTEDCFTCYEFQIKDGIDETITFFDMESSMEAPFYALDTSDKCMKNGGGFWRYKCQEDEKIAQVKKSEFGEFCCINKDFNECENKGGICADNNPLDQELSPYLRWICPGSKTCYVEKDAIYSYSRYIADFTEKGGSAFFVKPEEIDPSEISDISEIEDLVIEYAPKNTYAISFVSPSKQSCTEVEGEGGATCYAKVGGEVLLNSLPLGPGIPLGATVSVMKSVAGKIGGLFKTSAKKTEELTDISGENVPNLLLISTIEKAVELGCST